MNKQELVDIIASEVDLTKAQAQANSAVDAFVNAVTMALKKKKEVRLIGFGTFSVAKRKATNGRNPRTGEVIKIAASNQPKFKPGKALKDAVN